MLARANRLRTWAEFRRTLRLGRKVSGKYLSVSILRTDDASPARFGFIVSRKVGKAVTRNLLTRRLRAASRQLVDAGVSGRDVVVRVNPSAVESTWDSLREDFQKSTADGAKK